MKKNSFTLFLTIVITAIFSILSLNYFQVKSLKTDNLKNKIIYIQAKNHMDFLISLSKDYDFNEKIEIQNSDFEIFAIKIDNSIHYFVKSKNYSINLHEEKSL